MDDNKDAAAGATTNESGENKTFSISDPAESVRLEPETLRNINRLADIFERMNLGDYLTYMTRPRRVIIISFFVGLARGLGFVFGMTIVFGVIVLILGRMVDLPLIGHFIAQIVDLVNEASGASQNGK